VQYPQIKKPRFPRPDGFTLQPSASAHPPQCRQVPNFRSDFTLPHSSPSKRKQTPRTRPLPVVDLVPENRTSARDPISSGSTRHALVPDENAPSVASTARVLSPPLPPLPAMRPSKPTKVMEPPRFHAPPQRPSTPPSVPDLTMFLSDPPRPSKPVSKTRVALATDLWTEGGRADLLGLALEQSGVQHATPMEKAVHRGLEVSPRKAGISKEIRFVR
jgi:hypothetical protein